MKILNCGCGTKTSGSPDVINIDWSAYLRLKKNPIGRLLAPVLLSGERRARFRSLPDNIMVHDLRKGIPFPGGSADAVYHSHFLEHLDREAAGRFLLDIKRVLRPGGVHRIVVPDLELFCSSYLDHVAVCDAEPDAWAGHEQYIRDLIEPLVRTESYSTNIQKPLRRFVENLLFGPAAKRGDTHRWMYDFISLASILEQSGFVDVRKKDCSNSAIPGWAAYGLDVDETGREYKNDSLYVECIKAL